MARRPALAGVPFLLLFTIAGAVPRHAVAWVWFGAAAAGYLLLLGSDARDELSRWGRLGYRTMRHPALLLLGGPFFLIYTQRVRPRGSEVTPRIMTSVWATDIAIVEVPQPMDLPGRPRDPVPPGGHDPCEDRVP